MEIRNRIAQLILATLLPVGAWAAMEIACGINGSTDWDDSEPFADLFTMSRTWHYLPANASGDWPHEKKTLDNIPVDDQGYPLEIPFTLGGEQKRVATTMLNGRQKKAFTFGTYTLLFEGKGEIQLSNLVSTRTITHDGNGVKKYELEITEEHFKGQDRCDALRLNIMKSDPNNHIRNIRFIRPGYMDTYQDQPFTKEFLDDHRPFTVLRFMDWNSTNNSPQGSWAERRPKDWCSQTIAPTNPDNRGGVAYEWMIELCNTLQRDMWVTLPHLSDATYQRNLAKLIRDNLDKNLTCYVEWSNEVWNWNFKQTGYAKNQGMNVKNFSGKAGEAVNMYYTYASVNLFKIFEEEFSGERDRLVTVLSGRHNPATGDTRRVIEALDNPKVNPGGIVPDACATAPYLKVRGSSRTVSALHNDLRESISSRAAEGVRKWKGLIKSKGMRFITYEGGQHVAKIAEDLIIQANEHSGMYDIYREYLDSLEANGLEMLNAFVAVGRWGPHGAWGHKQYAGEPLSTAHKYRALWDYMVASGQVDPNKLPLAVSSAPAPGRVPVGASQVMAPRMLRVFQPNGRAVQSFPSMSAFRGLSTGAYIIRRDGAAAGIAVRR